MELRTRTSNAAALVDPYAELAAERKRPARDVPAGERCLPAMADKNEQTGMRPHGRSYPQERDAAGLVKLAPIRRMPGQKIPLDVVDP